MLINVVTSRKKGDFLSLVIRLNWLAYEAYDIKSIFNRSLEFSTCEICL